METPLEDPVGQTFSAPRRSFALPASLDDLDGPSASGLIVLPQHLDWSSRRSYDLDDPRDRRRIYEIVLREGALEDMRRYVDWRVRSATARLRRSPSTGIVVPAWFSPSEVPASASLACSALGSHRRDGHLGLTG